MRSAIPAAYCLITVLLLATPHATVALGLGGIPWYFIAGPLAYASAAMGAAAYCRQARGWLEVIAVALWGLGAVTVAAPISAPPREFVFVYRGFAVQGGFAGVVAASAALVGYRAATTERPILVRGIQTLSLLALFGLFGRWALRGLGVLPVTGGLASVSAEISLFTIVVVSCGTALLGSAAIECWRRRGLQRVVQQGDAPDKAPN